MAEATKEARIKREQTRLTRHFAGIEARHKAIAVPLSQNAAFMKATLEDLQEIINEEGLIDEYQNGSNQNGMKQSAALQGYNAMMKNYTAVTKALGNILLQASPAKEATLSSVMANLMEDE